MSNKRELCEYFEWLEQEFGRRLRAHIAWRYPSLSGADIDDVYQETMCAMLLRWHKHPELREDQALGPLLKKIARNKAYNVIHQRPVITGADLDAIAEGKGDDPHARYADPLEREELANLIVEAYELMDEDQKRVWHAFATHFPASRKYTTLASLAGMPGQARRASTLLKKAIKHIVRYLKRKGYDLD